MILFLDKTPFDIEAIETIGMKCLLKFFSYMEALSNVLNIKIQNLKDIIIKSIQLSLFVNVSCYKAYTRYLG